MEHPQTPYHTKTLPAEFFKVYLPQTSSTLLRIPKAFSAKFSNGNIGRKTALVDHEGNSWDVELKKMDDGLLVLKNGWKKFVRDKCLEQADFLVFEYDGNSKFHVKIFSKSGCRKEAAISGKFNPVMISDDEDSDLQNSKRKHERGVKRKLSPITPLKLNQKSHSKKGTTVRKSKRVKNGANGSNCESKASGLVKFVPLKNPHFVTPMSHWRMRKMEIPRRVTKELNISLKSGIMLRDEDDKLWPVKILTGDRGRCYFAKGWSSFWKAKSVEEGNLCDFKFVVGKENRAEELLVRVHSH
ncbi:hypothetical protein HN51_014583 [Arachis hypogaea]|uniref:TF-B3 domain-containing protein n=1 Tax=Arachis hypogaea TaxID=3818 RepID=A0A445CNW5_ARAHY|nr:putative B3 domain-containing protein At5g66980 [Arachis hypogaea]RYR52609.1 hypothetical protein Ahy_A06g027503 [Arachis hypogaea]